MADDPAARPARPPAAEAGDRGSLFIGDKVAQRIAAKAAIDTPGVRAHAAVLDKLTRRTLPKVQIMISADRARAALDIAVPWPYRLAEVTAAVRDNVARALADLAGLHVDGVDVAVSAIVATEDIPTARRVQ